MTIINNEAYSIFVGRDSLKAIDLNTYSSVAILVDENTKANCLSIFLSECPVKQPLIIEIKSGEKHKTIDTCQSIWQELTTHKFDRYSLLINLGGGVIGDMGGFAASCYKRGIDFIQVPTSLLAMVDASIGGKLGVDFSAFKNQIGLFRHPKCVNIFPDFLNTLEKRQLMSGLAEVTKYALVHDSDLWQQLKESAFEKMHWEQLISKCVEIKNNIVNEDPFENGKRKILNFGHTVGHAVESYYLSQNIDVLHGEAIVVGMLIESQLSPISEAEKLEIDTYLKSKFSLVNIPPIDALLPFIQNDKKNKHQRVIFSLLNKIGQCGFDSAVTNEQLKETLKSYI